LKCVIDANILIDLHNGEILSQLFDLELVVSTPDAVLDEMFEPDRNTLLDMGLQRMSLNPDQLLETIQIRATDSRLSLGDCAAFVAARDGDLLLLTGDKRLRDRAKSASVPTHGVLWILDKLDAANLLSPIELANSLRKMLTEGARLPANECEKRFRRWSGTE
jgi:rRNA-processing protein FCF1